VSGLATAGDTSSPDLTPGFLTRAASRRRAMDTDAAVQTNSESEARSPD
jgi:hypothetical protein